MSRLSSIVLVMCFSAPACSSDGDSNPDDGAVIPGWESATTTTDDGSILIQKVSYRSGGLRIYGQVCRPAGTGPFPLIVSNHGGATGLPSWNGGACADAARDGYVQIESSFRGQDGSGGQVELCLGEVDDVLRMIEIALEMPEVDRNRVVMWGSSLGGCITARALERGAPVKAAASVAGISNMKTAYDYWRAQLAAGAGSVAQYQILIAAANMVIGGPPEDFPDDYQRRSPINFTNQLPGSTPLLLAHGVDDQIAPPKQSCELAQRLGVQGHHFDAQHQLVATTPLGCEGLWTTSAAPIGTWSGARYLLVYDGVAGVAEGAAATAMDVDVESFLSAKLR